jgi:hypothetical protein
VPLLVVSAWTGTQAQNGVTGYVSGACGQPPLPSCPNFGPNDVYVHDFGSILAFTEWNFGMQNITYPDPYYADYNAPDWSADRKTPPLSDFFQLPVNQPRPFVSIPVGTYGYKCFENVGSCWKDNAQYVPEDPDDY